MASLYQNDSAEKTISILTELIKSGRYANPSSSPIRDLMDDAAIIKEKLEELYAK